MKRFQISSDKITLFVTDTGVVSQKWNKLRILLKRVLLRFEDYLSKEIEECELTLTLCGEKKIRKLNSKYRGKDRVTDVLSFPVHEEIPSISILALGDIFICKDVASKQGFEFKISYEEEIIHLLIHGFLHLLGYDHEKNEDARFEMEKEENVILERM